MRRERPEPRAPPQSISSNGLLAFGGPGGSVMPKAPQQILGHWSGMVEGLQVSPLEFYASLDHALEQWQIPGARRERVEWREGGLLTAKREYLRIQRGEYIIDICAAPFGSGFFVSWWLGEFTGCLVDFIPGLKFLRNLFVSARTYYAYDTALMFKSAVHQAVQDVIDDYTKTKGVRALGELDRKPVMRDFLTR